MRKKYNLNLIMASIKMSKDSNLTKNTFEYNNILNIEGK